ncbi:hypothetical protein HB852_01450 [Listeria grandensis]|uniref:hypothetical protein n=1 Tax=Listeria grandensis TaxID=1494963 RepID=UPI0016271966|nr:hypothetical protein [Listeria grandensis]MBC1473283.1 hypothetical protein [Listeria grandensis]
MDVNLSEIKSSNEMDLIDLKIMNIVAEKITLPKMDGSAGSALYKIPFRLNASPPSRWARYLIHFWDNPTRYTTMHRPGIASVRADCIWLEGTTLEEVKKYHKITLEQAIVRANNAYNDEIKKDEQRRILKEQKERDLINNINNELKDINF